MRTTWNDNGEDKAVTSPMTGVITAFAPVADVRKTLTPELKNLEDSVLVRIDLSKGQFRLGGSILLKYIKQLVQSLLMLIVLMISKRSLL